MNIYFNMNNLQTQIGTIFEVFSIYFQRKPWDIIIGQIIINYMEWKDNM